MGLGIRRLEGASEGIVHGMLRLASRGARSNVSGYELLTDEIRVGIRRDESVLGPSFMKVEELQGPRWYCF